MEKKMPDEAIIPSAPPLPTRSALLEGLKSAEADPALCDYTLYRGLQLGLIDTDTLTASQLAGREAGHPTLPPFRTTSCPIKAMGSGSALSHRYNSIKTVYA